MRRPLTKDEKFIPPGPYCYETIHITPDYVTKALKCPYWEHREDKPSQECGYCHFIEKGDWEENGTSLLWDQIKECGIKDEFLDATDDGLTEKLNQDTMTWGKLVLSLLDEDDRESGKEKLVIDWLRELEETEIVKQASESVLRVLKNEEDKESMKQENKMIEIIYISPEEAKEMDFNRAVSELKNRVYTAALLLETFEHAGKSYGNGHHQAQNVAEMAGNVLAKVWKEQKETEKYRKHHKVEGE